MIPLLGSPGDLLREAVENTAGRAIAGGAPAPPWIAVEGEDEGWLRQLFGQPRHERRRGVAVVSSDSGLGAAIAAGVGGAVWLPPATGTMAEAMRAAAAGPGVGGIYSPEAGIALARALGMGDCLAVTFAGLALWRTLLGGFRLERLLTALAEGIGCRFLLIEGPVLLLDGCGEREVASAWETMRSAEPLVPEDGLRLAWIDVAGVDPGTGGLCDVLPPESWRAIGGGSGLTKPRPVFELPSGRRVGVWRPGGSISNEDIPRTGWIATGSEHDATGRTVWRLTAAGRPAATVPEVSSLAGIGEAGKAPAVRMPGWTTGELGEGTPGGLLLERLVRGANGAGLPLWVPNVTDRVLRRLLRLGGRVWVDGPAVPDGRG